MTEQEQIKKAIRHFECMKNDAVVVLDSGFGTRKGESDTVYRNRKMYAELAIKALEITQELAKRNMTMEVLENYMQFEDECVKKGFTFSSMLEAREKQIPKKDNNDNARCRNCGTHNNFIVDKLFSPKDHPVVYCWNCGQAIDWSEEDANTSNC